MNRIISQLKSVLAVFVMLFQIANPQHGDTQTTTKFYPQIKDVFNIKQKTSIYDYPVYEKENQPISFSISSLRDIAISYKSLELPVLPAIGFLVHSEKTINQIPNSGNRIKTFELRVLYPNIGVFTENMMVEGKFYLLKAINKDDFTKYGFISPIPSRKEGVLSNLNFVDGWGGELSINAYISNLFLNIHLNISDSSGFADKLPAKISQSNRAYYSFVDYSLTISSYTILYGLTKLLLEAGIGGYNVAAKELVNGVSQVSQLAILNPMPYFGFEFYLFSRKDIYRLGLSCNYFDGHVKAKGWVSIFALLNPAIESRIQINYLSNRLHSKQKEWEIGEKPVVDFAINFRYGF